MVCNGLAATGELSCTDRERLQSAFFLLSALYDVVKNTHYFLGHFRCTIISDINDSLL